MDNGASSYRRFLDGDDTGLAEIIREYNTGLTLYINSFVGDLSAADELSEDTFVKIGVKKPRFSGRSSFKTWLYAIGRNIALDYLRKTVKSRAISLEDCTEQTDAMTAESEYLKAEYRQILWLIYFEELSIREAAKVLHKSVHNAESLVSRARQALRSKLNQEGYFYENL